MENTGKYWLVYGVIWCLINIIIAFGMYYWLKIPTHRNINVYLAIGFLMFGLIKFLNSL